MRSRPDDVRRGRTRCRGRRLAGRAGPGAPSPMKRLAALALPLLLLARAGAPALRAADAALERQADGVVIAVGDAFLKVEVCADDMIRVASARDKAFFTRASLVVDRRRAAPAAWDLATDAASA